MAAPAPRTVAAPSAAKAAATPSAAKPGAVEAAGAAAAAEPASTARQQPEGAAGAAAAPAAASGRKRIQPEPIPAAPPAGAAGASAAAAADLQQGEQPAAKKPRRITPETVGPAPAVVGDSQQVRAARQSFLSYQIICSCGCLCSPEAMHAGMLRPSRTFAHLQLVGVLRNASLLAHPCRRPVWSCAATPSRRQLPPAPSPFGASPLSPLAHPLAGQAPRVPRRLPSRRGASQLSPSGRCQGRRHHLPQRAAACRRNQLSAARWPSGSRPHRCTQPSRQGGPSAPPPPIRLPSRRSQR